jgi:hypothetical protein
LKVICTQPHNAERDKLAGELAGLRAALREFGAAWRPLPPGGVLRRSFTP